MTDAAADQPADTAASLHQALVDQLCHAGLIPSAAVEAALRAVPRHLFLPGVPLEQVYRDQPVVTKQLDDRPVSSSSQPAIMAVMLEQLDLQPGHRVLEVGAGTGYNAALLAHLVGATGQVTTIDLDPDIVERARAHLATAGVGNVTVVWGDGGLGYAAAAPYDRIIVTARPPDLLPAWHAQLRVDGRLVTPLQLRSAEQRVITFQRRADHWVSVALVDGGFMALRGVFEPPAQPGVVQLESAPGVSISVPDGATVDAAAVAALVNGSYTERATATAVTPPELMALHRWLMLQDARSYVLLAEGAAAQQATTPCLVAIADTQCVAEGLVTAQGLSLLVRPPTVEVDGAQDGADDAAVRVWIRGYGQHTQLTNTLMEYLAAWEGAGRPGLDGVRILVYPEATTELAEPAERLLPMPWSRWVCDWPARAS